MYISLSVRPEHVVLTLSIPWGGFELFRMEISISLFLWYAYFENNYQALSLGCLFSIFLTEIFNGRDSILLCPNQSGT